MSGGLDTFPLDTWPLDAVGTPIPAERNRDRPVAATPTIVWHDGDEDVSEGPWGREITMPVLVVLDVASKDPTELGGLLNASYTQVVAALATDPHLGARVREITEGDFRPDFPTVGAPAASGELELVLKYIATSASGQREAILEALDGLLASTVPQIVGRREVVIEAFRAQLADELGIDVAAIQRNRLRRQQPGTIILREGSQSILTRHTGEVLYRAFVTVRTVVRGNRASELGPALSASIDAIRAASLVGDRTLAGAAEDLREGDEEGSALNSTIVTTVPAAPTAVGDLTFQLIYATAEDDPTAAAEAA